MPPMFYLAYGEGQFSSTASGIFSALVVFVICCVAFGLYSYQTYPNERE
ncbi:MAG: hypothetical protein AAF722_18045 [Cyanobacteria bacterium P01_C01_bin.70]